MRLKLLLTLCLFQLCIQNAFAQAKPGPWRPYNQNTMVRPLPLDETPQYGWHTDYLGFLRGNFDMSVGIKAWPTRFSLDNFVFGGQVDILPGLRARIAFRHREGNEFPHIDADEIYLEGYDAYRAPSWDASFSLRIGHIRYLHIPYPDALSLFDSVPGTQDQYSPVETDYRSVVLEGDFATHSGFGLHWTGRAAGFSGGETPAGTVIDAYGFYRTNFLHSWHVEVRGGDLAVRALPLGQAGQPGYSAYLGKQLGEFNVGVFYEHKRTEPDYSGIAVQFRSTPITRTIGHYMIDYSRHPDGFTAQIPLLHIRFGEHTKAPKGGILMGQVSAIRIKTIDAQGFVRNQYEHRIASWGDTADPHLICVVKSQPWYLQAEALFSPHTLFTSSWFHNRAGPGQYVQRVIYNYYKVEKH